MRHTIERFPIAVKNLAIDRVLCTCVLKPKHTKRGLSRKIAFFVRSRKTVKLYWVILYHFCQTGGCLRKILKKRSVCDCSSIQRRWCSANRCVFILIQIQYRLFLFLFRSTRKKNSKKNHDYVINSGGKCGNCLAGPRTKLSNPIPSNCLADRRDYCAILLILLTTDRVLYA